LCAASWLPRVAAKLSHMYVRADIVLRRSVTLYVHDAEIVLGGGVILMGGKAIPLDMPPDVTAGIFWLKNRDPAHWRDAWQIEASVGRYIISDKPMTPEQWIAERATNVDAEPAQLENKSTNPYGEGDPAETDGT
jgi:hypothetical protein